MMISTWMKTFDWFGLDHFQASHQGLPAAGMNWVEQSMYSVHTDLEDERHKMMNLKRVYKVHTWPGTRNVLCLYRVHDGNVLSETYSLVSFVHILCTYSQAAYTLHKLSTYKIHTQTLAGYTIAKYIPSGLVHTHCIITQYELFMFQRCWYVLARTVYCRYSATVY